MNLTKNLPAAILAMAVGIMLYTLVIPPQKQNLQVRNAPSSPAIPSEKIPDPPESSYQPLIVQEPSLKPAGMKWIPGGTFTMGTNSIPDEKNIDRIKPDEIPAHEVELDGFYIDEAPVTNEEFLEFVNDTGYVTFAEKKPKREDFADVFTPEELQQIPEENLVAGSLCFNPDFDRENLVTGVNLWEYQAWKYQPGANWKHPEGPGSDIKDRMNHPVVHVSYDDAVAYLKWAGKRLPTEAEYEYAHRGGSKGTKYFWGDELVPQGKYFANYWQGSFPLDRQNLDSFLVTSPVKSFPANGYGLYDMAGNVWEWCHDFYRPDYYQMSPRRNPQGPDRSFDPGEPHIKNKHVTRGGSFMCNTNNCTGYRIAARMRAEANSPAFHQGFRGVVDTHMIENYHKAPRQQLKKQ